MSEAIKLFGKTINLNLLPDNFISDDDNQHIRHPPFSTSTSQDSKNESITRSGHESTINPRDETEESSEVDDDDDANNTPTKDQKTVKKPEKTLPCPRCNSMDTKFCYYNNYNVNQPRYFCKKCQRYWTSGGTMRNVPVGSGRRKNKPAVAPNFHHIMVSDARFLIGPNSGGYPVSFYPGTTAYWVPTCSLGKHSREEATDGGLISKTLRIDDPNEAAKSSIWSTLKEGSLNGTGIFKAFESKGAGRRTLGNTDMVLQANPAAFSRSINFHERA